MDSEEISEDLSEKEIQYNSWNQKQKILDLHKRNLLFKKGEIWWCSVGMNIGEEVYGKGENFTRPVVILKKLSHNTCVVLPITTKVYKSNWYHPFTHVEKPVG